MSTIRERFEALQRHTLEDSGATGNYWIGEDSDGGLLQRDDALALADALDAENRERVIRLAQELFDATGNAKLLEVRDGEKAWP